MARINFIELPAPDLGAAQTFYSAVFGWEMTNFGPSYSFTMTGKVDLGLQGDSSEAPSMPLPVVLVDAIEAAQTAVVEAGGIIGKPI
ncbi:VOC family protein [Novosphingobium sp. RD2P27]|uniref:VOC family protein n=1 Tax=Novosphingobium kalidii TaxID=3230299 RepID=A0ABV2D160_9SPHN